ncbi:2-isopropylmalate synthase [Rhodococcus sp. T7]|nr:2-isopropylmalate synthase [Rhodococcus sp. T7]
MYTAFSGTHQDAIKKGFAEPIRQGRHRAPAAERVRHHPAATLQIDFAAKVQEAADSSGLEITAEQLWTLFCAEYGYRGGLGRRSVEHGPDGDRLFVVFDVDGVEVSGEAVATGPVEAMTRVLTSKGVDVDVLSLTQHSQRSGSDSAAITLAECRVRSAPVSTY